MENFKQLKYAFFGLLLIMIIAIAGLGYFEGIDPLHALWFVIVSLTTVGYGDWVPQTVQGKIFTIFLILSGVSLFTYALGTFLTLIVEGHLTNILERRGTLRKINELQDHYIICGAGRVGKEIALRIKKEAKPFVIIDTDNNKLTQLAEQGMLSIFGDATEDETLIRAGIHRAKGLVTSLPDDANNVYVVLSAKQLNPSIKVVARANSPEAETKLSRAGADKVISPATIGGRKMAVSLLKPASVDFIDTLMGHSGEELELEEIPVMAGSSLVNKDLQSSKIREVTGTYVLAILRGDRLISTPMSDWVINRDDLLIAFGTRAQLEKLETMASNLLTD